MNADIEPHYPRPVVAEDTSAFEYEPMSADVQQQLLENDLIEPINLETVGASDENSRKI